MQNIYLKEVYKTTKKHLKVTCNNNNIPNDHTLSKMYTTHCNMNRSIWLQQKMKEKLYFSQ